MNISMMLEVNDKCTVRRVTPDGYKADQQVTLRCYSAGDGPYTSVTFFARTVAAADALAAAFALCGVVLESPLNPANETGEAQSGAPEATAK